MRVAGQKAPALGTVTGQLYSFLMLGESSRVGYSGGPPRIAYSSNWALELANASSRAKDTRIKYCRRTVLPLLDAWKTDPSGMRHQTASHCAFAKLGPQTSEYTPGPSNIGEVALSTVILYVCLMFVNASRAGCGGELPRITYFAE